MSDSENPAGGTERQSKKGRRRRRSKKASGSRAKKGALAADQHFDLLAKPLANNIYGSYKGRLRLALLQDDLLPLVESGQSLLDVGAGMAQISAQARQQGLDVYAFDAAEEMRQQAEAYALANFDWSWQTRYQVMPLQAYTLPESVHAGFDWVWCHAVLAWLQDPADGLRRITEWVCPGGRVSLLFYNRDSMALQQIFRGRYGYLEKLWARTGEQQIVSVSGVDGAPSSKTNASQALVEPFYPGGLTPQTPLDPQWVCETLEDLGFSVLFQRGVRCFADYMQSEVRARMTEAQLLAVERTYRRRMPYLGMARYIHVVAQKTF